MIAFSVILLSVWLTVCGGTAHCPWRVCLLCVWRVPAHRVRGVAAAVVTTPSGKKAYPKVLDNRDGTVAIQYQPTEVGLHSLDVAYNKEPIRGSPFTFHVDGVNSGFVTAYGPGLAHGISGQPCNFTIVTKDASAGQWWPWVWVVGLREGRQRRSVVAVVWVVGLREGRQRRSVVAVVWVVGLREGRQRRSVVAVVWVVGLREGRQRRSVVAVGVGGRAAGRTPAPVSGGRGCG